MIVREDLARMARVHPTAWALYASQYAGTGDWCNARHFDLLASKVLRCHAEAARVRAGGKPSEEPGAQRLCVSMPPGSGKSEYLSMAVASWWLGTRPRDRVVVASYSRSLAMGWGQRARDTFAALGAEVFGVGADPRQRAHEWVPRDPVLGTPYPGYFYSVGRGGTLTGKRAELLIIDDLLKDDLEAGSAAVRGHAWRWLDKVAMTRLLPWTVVIQIATRWHPEDPIGQLEAKQERGEVDMPWEFVNLPALCEDSKADPLGRAVGESLWPEMWTAEQLEGVRRGRDPRTWAALYQGRPVPEGGQLFDPCWLLPYRERESFFDSEGRAPINPERLVRYATIDLAYSTKTTSDYTVVCVWGGDLEAGDLYLMHVERDRIGAENLAARIGGVFDAWGIRRGYLERSGFYAGITRELRKSLPLSLIQPNTDKVARAQPAIAFAAGGGLLVRDEAPWLPALREELQQFPHGSHDDQMDAIAYGVHVFDALRRRRNVRTRYRRRGA